MKCTVLVSVFLLFTFIGCVHHDIAPTSSDSQGVRDLRWLYTAHPERDLTSALAHIDHRFIGIAGYTEFTPGVDRGIANRYGIRILKGTSDMVDNEEHLRLNMLASRYAEQYNKLLLQRLPQ